jgi:Na+/proline symporter
MTEVTLELTWIDWAVVFAYGIFMFGVAFWAFPKIKDCGGFLVGSRKMGKLMMVAAAFAGGTNANHPIAVSAAAFQKGMSGIWLSLTWMLITPFFWMYPPALRRLRIVTMADVVRMRFGSTMAMIFKIVLLAIVPIGMGLGIKSAAIVLEVMTGGVIAGFHAELAIVLPTLIYTLLGGVIAAYATDIWQGLLIVFLSFLLIPFAIFEAGGIAALDAGISDEMNSLFSGVGGDFGFWWVFWFAIGIMFSAVIATAGGSAAAVNEMAARMKTFGMVIKRFCTVGWGLVGLFGIALFAGHPLVDPSSGNELASPDNIFPLASGSLLPVGLRGLMVASILAAVMSSLDASMVKFAGMFVSNIYQEHWVKKASARHYLTATRVFAGLGIIIGWWVSTGVEDIVEFATIVEPLGSLTGIAILVALMWRRVTAAAAITSVLIAAPLFLAVNRPTWPEWEWVTALAGQPVSLFQLMQLQPIADWMAGLYGLDLMDPALGYYDENGVLSRLPVQIKYPMYIIPTLLTLGIVSLFTRQHNQHAVDEFYCRLDTPVGDEDKIRAAGFSVDQLEFLDEDEIVVAPEHRDVSKRLLLVDLFYLPKLLKSGEAKFWDYKWDWIGLVGSIIFVIGFLFAVEAFGKLF